MSEMQHTATHCNTNMTHCNTDATRFNIGPVLRCVCERETEGEVKRRERCNREREDLRGATHCNKLQNTATHCNTLQNTTTHYSTLQHTAAHCRRERERDRARKRGMNLRCTYTCVRCARRIVLQCVAVCCSVLQCVALCCSVLQCVAVCLHLRVYARE